MVKEASSPINFTVFLTMFGEKLKGADPEYIIVSTFKVLDPEATGFIKKEFLEELLTTQCDRFSAEEVSTFLIIQFEYHHELSLSLDLMSG